MDRRGFTPPHGLTAVESGKNPSEQRPRFPRHDGRGLRGAGFTLLELLMVVIIIGILASIALPQYMRVSERARASEALQILATIRGSELRFKASDPAGLYTTTLTSLDVEGPGFGAPASTLWTYTVSGTGAGSNAVATRVGFGAKSVQTDLDSGATCASDPIYGLKATPC